MKNEQDQNVTLQMSSYATDPFFQCILKEIESYLPPSHVYLLQSIIDHEISGPSGKRAEAILDECEVEGECWFTEMSTLEFDVAVDYLNVSNEKICRWMYDRRIVVQSLGSSWIRVDIIVKGDPNTNRLTPYWGDSGCTSTAPHVEFDIIRHQCDEYNNLYFPSPNKKRKVEEEEEKGKESDFISKTWGRYDQ